MANDESYQNLPPEVFEDDYYCRMRQLSNSKKGCFFAWSMARFFSTMQVL